MKNKLIGLRTSVEETENYFKEQIDSVDSFKEHQSRILTSVSLIVSVAGLLLGKNETPVEIPLCALISIGVLFCVILLIFAFVMMPVSLDTPLKIDRSIFNRAFIGKTEEKILNNKLKNYIIVINQNRKKITKLIWASRVSVVAFLLILVIVFYIIYQLI